MKDLKLKEGHKKDMWFIQEKSKITKRYEIVGVYYNKQLAEDTISYRKQIGK